MPNTSFRFPGLRVLASLSVPFILHNDKSDLVGVGVGVHLLRDNIALSIILPR